MIQLPEDLIKEKDTETLQKVLLDRVVKLRKLSKEMRDSPQVQKAQDALEMAKHPFKKVRAKWMSEIEVIELELKTRNIKYNINWDDIYEEE